VSPSKRAGDTVDDDQESVNGHGAPEGRAVGSPEQTTARAKPRRRSVVSSGAAPSPERGTTSQRGSSSSTITKRGRFAEDEIEEGAVSAGERHAHAAPAATSERENGRPVGGGGPDAAAPPADVAAVGRVTNVLVEPAAVVPVPPPPPPPPARVDPGARRVVVSPEPEPAVMPVPITAPAGSPTAHQGRTLSEADGPMAPPEPPYASTMTTHGVAPVPRVLGRRPRVRRVTRVVRHVDPWSVFKVALVFNLVLYGVLLTAGVLLWNVAYATGTVDNLERFFESFGWTEFEFDGGAIYHASWIAGLFGVVGLTGATVLAATLFNLITDLVGGIRMTVLEEEVQERTQAPMRRFVVRRPSSSADPSAGLRREIDRLPPGDQPPTAPPVG
jgi:hypothetical protein